MDSPFRPGSFRSFRPSIVTNRGIPAASSVVLVVTGACFGCSVCCSFSLETVSSAFPGAAFSCAADETGAGYVYSISRTVRIASERRSVQVEIPHTTTQPMKVKKIRVSIPGNFIKKVLSRLTQFDGKVIPSVLQIDVFFVYLINYKTGHTSQYQIFSLKLVCLSVFFLIFE
jgi:hypothetical protein